MSTPGDTRSRERMFRDGHAAYHASNGEGFEHRIVLARDIIIPDGYEPLPTRLDHMRPGFQHERRRFESPSAPAIAVMELADGSLWTFDDVPILSLFHEMASLARLRVAIVASERPQTAKPGTFRHAPRRR